MNKIALIGHVDHGKTTLVSAIKDLVDMNLENLIIVDDNEEPDIIKNFKYDPMPMLFSRKQFKCKGKHQYRQSMDGIWICECGRKV